MRAEVTRRIQSLGRANKPREAVLQLAEMAKLGVQPDTQAATALIDACARNGNMDMAQSVFDELFGAYQVLSRVHHHHVQMGFCSRMTLRLVCSCAAMARCGGAPQLRWYTSRHTMLLVHHHTDVHTVGAAAVVVHQCPAQHNAAQVQP